MVRTLARQHVGYLRRPLNVIFGAPSHVAILRALGRRPAGATGRELARAAGVAHQATLDALTRLEAVGIVSRLPMGRGYVFRLNREHGLVRRGLLPLLEGEAAFKARLRARLKAAFEGDVVSGVIYGSTGRGEDRPESDLDVCLVVRRAHDKERVLQCAGELAGALWRGFGVRLSPVVFTVVEFSRALGRERPLFKNIMEDGERFVGKPLERVESG